MEPLDLLGIAREIVARVTWCFAITKGADGSLNARLVQPAPPDDDWRVRFLTHRQSRKAAEMAREGRLTLAYQHDPDRAYVTLVGHVVLRDDVEGKRAIWRPETYRFHPGGPEDPDNLLVAFRAERVELYSAAHAVAPPPRGFSAAVLLRGDTGWAETGSFPG